MTNSHPLKLMFDRARWLGQRLVPACTGVGVMQETHADVVVDSEQGRGLMGSEKRMPKPPILFIVYNPIIRRARCPDFWHFRELGTSGFITGLTLRCANCGSAPYSEEQRWWLESHPARILISWQDCQRLLGPHSQGVPCFLGWALAFQRLQMCCSPVSRPG